MSKAILGSFADPRTLELLDEIRALRARVASLETALEQAEEVAARRLDDEPVLVPSGPDPDAVGMIRDEAAAAAESVSA